jgi:8-oxo-dGTP diphosphatase
MDPEITALYGNKIRVRACGLCWQEDKLLMVNHRALMPGDFWAPPGGGLEFGEAVEECLKKEFAEETGLIIIPGRLLFVCEFMRKPLHAIELFFEVVPEGGALRKGDDPELPIIEEVRFMSPDDIAKIPSDHLHGIFRFVASPGDLKTLTGFFRI